MSVLEWDELEAERREKMLRTMREMAAQGLELSESSLSPLRVVRGFRRGATLHVHAVTDTLEYQSAQSGSDWEEHIVYLIESGFTLTGTLVSQETKVAYYGTVIEYQMEGYDREGVLLRAMEKLRGQSDRRV